MVKTRMIHLVIAVLEVVSNSSLISLPNYGAKLWALCALTPLVFYFNTIPHHINNQ
jgi:hypothetical protein